MRDETSLLEDMIALQRERKEDGHLRGLREDTLGAIEKLTEIAGEIELQLDYLKTNLYLLQRRAVRVGKKPVEIDTIKGKKITWVDEDEEVL